MSDAEIILLALRALEESSWMDAYDLKPSMDPNEVRAAAAALRKRIVNVIVRVVVESVAARPTGAGGSAHG